MSNGFVTVYTGEGGLRQYIDSGECQGKIRPAGKFDIPILVPRESVTYEIKKDDPNGNMEDMLVVKL